MDSYSSFHISLLQEYWVHVYTPKRYRNYFGQDINIKQSYLVGDSDSDIIAGKNFGLNTIKVDRNFTLNNWLKTIL